MHPAVAHLVYLTAFALEVGESARENALTGGEGRARSTPRSEFGDGVLTLDPELAIAGVLPRLRRPRSRAARGRSAAAAVAGGAAAARSTAAAWREKPATYVVCTDDRALPVALQRSNAARIGNSIDWPTSHSPFLSRPELVADLLVELSSR